MDLDAKAKGYEVIRGRRDMQKGPAFRSVLSI